MQSIDWNKELEDLKCAARTPEDKAATEAFAKAIAPYLANPDMLRTLLGKIQAPVPASAFSVVVGQRQFASLDELKAKLPRSVEIVDL